MIMKENLRFTQLRLNYINNNKKISKISNNSCQDRCGFKCTRTIGYRLASIFLKKHENTFTTYLSVTVFTFNQ